MRKSLFPLRTVFRLVRMIRRSNLTHTTVSSHRQIVIKHFFSLWPIYNPLMLNGVKGEAWWFTIEGNFAAELFGKFIEKWLWQHYCWVFMVRHYLYFGFHDDVGTTVPATFCQQYFWFLFFWRSLNFLRLFHFLLCRDLGKRVHRPSNNVHYIRFVVYKRYLFENLLFFQER